MAGMAAFVGVIFLIVFLLISVGLLILQVFLSLRPNRWPGLILPIASFVFSLLLVGAFSLFMTNQFVGFNSISSEDAYVTEDGTYYGEADQYGDSADNGVGIIGSADGPTQIFVANTDSSDTLLSVLMLLLPFNIPTALYLLAYLICRLIRKKRDDSELDKMKIQDL